MHRRDMNVRMLVRGLADDGWMLSHPVLFSRAIKVHAAMGLLLFERPSPQSITHFIHLNPVNHRKKNISAILWTTSMYIPAPHGRGDPHRRWEDV